MKTGPALLCAALLAGLGLRADETGGWTLAKVGDGVEVSTRPLPGWGMKEFRAVTRGEGTLAGAVTLMADIAAYPEWFSDCREARLVQAQSPRERIVYFVQRAPFPVRDRDLVTHFRIAQDPATHAVTLRLQAEPDAVPPVAKRVRVPRMEGCWTFTPLAGGRLEIVYQVRSDPGGSLPEWLANLTVADGPWETLRGLRRKLGEARYRAARLDWLCN